MRPRGLDIVSPQALGSDIEYPLRSNALSAKSILGGRVALTKGFIKSLVLDRQAASRNSSLVLAYSWDNCGS